MAKVTPKLLLALSFGIAMAAGAQNLEMTPSDRSSTFDAAGKPTRGMTQQAVEANYGAPQNAQAAIGDPPITRWEYPNFVVFFEYDKVIHSVSR